MLQQESPTIHSWEWQLHLLMPACLPPPWLNPLFAWKGLLLRSEAVFLAASTAVRRSSTAEAAGFSSQADSSLRTASSWGDGVSSNSHPSAFQLSVPLKVCPTSWSTKLSSSNFWQRGWGPTESWSGRIPNSVAWTSAWNHSCHVGIADKSEGPK
jgi:hypothetical protein